MLSRSFRMLRIAGNSVDDIDLQQGQPTRSLRRLLGEGDQTNLRSTVTSQLRLAGGHCCDRQDCGEDNVHQFDDALPSGECAPTGGVFFDKGRRCRRVGAGTVSDLVVPGGIHGCVPGGESRRASAHRREGRSGGRVCGSNGVAGAGGMAFFVGSRGGQSRGQPRARGGLSDAIVSVDLVRPVGKHPDRGRGTAGRHAGASRSGRGAGRRRDVRSRISVRASRGTRV